MKVLLLNGSPHAFGCTYTALDEIAKILSIEGIDSEIFYVGTDPIAPCRACGACSKFKKCVISDKVNEFLKKAAQSDGLIIGSPVHYASASGAIVPFLDRAFFAGSRSDKNIFTHKPGASIVTARRAGTTSTIDELNKYFLISQMPIISSRYWPMVYGSTPDEVKKDIEGMQIMRILAKNFAWYLKSMEVAKKAGITPPEKEKITHTSFIR